MFKKELGIPVNRPKKAMKQLFQDLENEMRTTGTIKLADKGHVPGTLVTFYRVL
jgi:hypothetical protein